VLIEPNCDVFFVVLHFHHDIEPKANYYQVKNQTYSSFVQNAHFFFEWSSENLWLKLISVYFKKNVFIYFFGVVNPEFGAAIVPVPTIYKSGRDWVPIIVEYVDSCFKSIVDNPLVYTADKANDNKPKEGERE